MAGTGGPWDLILKGAGAGVSAYGQTDADYKNAQKYEELGAFKDWLKGEVEPMEGDLIKALTSGQAADAFAAEGLQKAADNRYASGLQSRSVGSRTSAKAREMQMEGAETESILRNAAQIAGQAQSDKYLSALDLLMSSAAMPASQFYTNQLGGYGNALSGLGDSLSDMDWGDDDPKNNVPGNDADYPYNQGGGGVTGEWDWR